MERKKVVIMGAAGRDFHNFNCVLRNDKTCEVVAFTAAQIPDIEGRKYPAKLAGKFYPKGIPIVAEEEIPVLIDQHDIDEVIFSYSDVSYDHVMSLAAVVNSCGADFKLLGVSKTMLESKKPIVAVGAVRTGCGKSQTTRKVCAVLQGFGLKVVAVRHPMPYGDLTKQVCQRFASLSDLDRHECTIEEREEYEPHINQGIVVYAGVDYGVILEQAEKEADVIVWDGGNNDLPFYRPDVHITVADPHRAGHELTYYPGEANLLQADIIIINKVETAPLEGIEAVRNSIRMLNPEARVIEAASPIFVDDPDIITGKKVLVVEDGPTLTHGEMSYGAGVLAANKYGAAQLLDPRPYTVGTMARAFEKYPHIGPLLPAMGYSQTQIRDLERTINKTKAEAVIIATPIDLRRLINIKMPSTRVSYELQEIGLPDLKSVLGEYFGQSGKRPKPGKHVAARRSTKTRSKKRK